MTGFRGSGKRWGEWLGRDVAEGSSVATKSVGGRTGSGTAWGSFATTLADGGGAAFIWRWLRCHQTNPPTPTTATRQIAAILLVAKPRMGTPKLAGSSGANAMSPVRIASCWLVNRSSSEGSGVV